MSVPTINVVTSVMKLTNHKKKNRLRRRRRNMLKACEVEAPTCPPYEGEATDEYKARLASGVIKWEDVPVLFPRGTEVVFDGNTAAVGGIVENGQFGTGYYGVYWLISIRVIAVNSSGRLGIQFANVRVYQTPANEFKLNDLSLQVISSSKKALLHERGLAYREQASAPCYREYDGEFLVRGIWGLTPVAGRGRIMIDVGGCRQQEPNLLYSLGSYFTDECSRNDDNDSSTENTYQIPDDMIWMSWDSLPAFSFRNKTWGLIAVGKTSPVTFHPEAFDTLVMDANKKKVITALVAHAGNGFADIIAGKSGGFIFLLHGAPGTGKTLTAEATAELFRRPLYMVSIGELGTDPRQLEEHLSSILELSQRWDAVLLLDEADIFLEQRTDHDLLRNAMVGVFLRQLEYFNGIMFLTTNRVKNFDKAFHSRISLAFMYPMMDDSIRAKIWTNLLGAANIKKVNIKKLAELQLNGRQIKNIIRLAQSVSAAEKGEVDTKMLVKMADFSTEFTADLESTKNFN